MIDVRYCLFHGIEPLIEKDKHKKEIDEIILRLELMLSTGFLFPGNKLDKIIDDKYIYTKNSEDSVFFALSIDTLVPLVGGGYRNGIFSAYEEHILGNASLVFSNKILDGAKIKTTMHLLSEEICIQGNVSLDNVIAIALPYITPLEEIEQYQTYVNNKVTCEIIKDLRPRIINILNNPKIEVRKVYEKIDVYKNILKKFQKDIPCIHYTGDIYNEEKELSCIEKKVKIISKTL